MKKFMIFMLVGILLISIAACSAGDTSVDTPESSVQPGSSGNVTDGGVTGGNDDTVFQGDITETVVRGYKTASESDFEYEDTPVGIRITGYIGKDTIVVIPDKIAGKDVIHLTVNSFGAECAVRGVIVPAGIKELSGVFCNNKNIEVVIWESAENVGANMFNGCTALHTVILGDKFTNLGDNAFAFCAKLEELYVPATVQGVDADYPSTIFYGCEKLTVIGEAGSFIESFCAEQGVNFKAQ